MFANHRHEPRQMLQAGTALLLVLAVMTPAAAQIVRTTGSTSGSPVACEEMNAKARALVDSGKTEEARRVLIAAIQTCEGTGSRADNERLAAALNRLGLIEYMTQPREALEHFRRAMTLDPENMRAARNAGGMLISLGQYEEALEVLEQALKHGSDDKENLFGLEFNAGLALLKMCAARQVGCDPARLEEHFVRASELNPTFADTFFNLAAIANDIHRDSRRAMELFKRACDLGHKQGCFQYEHFSSRFAAIDRQAPRSQSAANTVEGLAERIRQTHTCPAVAKSTQHQVEGGILTWTIECTGDHVYTVIVGRAGETTVIQRQD